MVIGCEQLNKEQKRVIDGYSTGAHQAINPHLRNDPKFDMLGNLEWNIKIMDSIFDIPTGRLNPPILFRGTQNNDMYNNPTFTEKGYMSTSSEENIVWKKFILTDKHILLKIHLQCCNINLLKIDGKIKESEYLIPRNTQFRVLYRGEEKDSVPFIGVCPT